MLRKIILLSFLLISFAATAQDQALLLKQELISDWSKYPVYARLSEEVAGERQWKKEYQYLDSIEVYRISYLSDGLKVMGLMAKPKAEGHYPCIIFNRGGNRNYGALKVYHGALSLGKLAKEGYVVIASQYRGNASGEGQEEFGGADVNDITILPQVLAEVEDADTSRIGMYGWSRGGMMTYLALKDCPQIKAAVVGAGNSDLTINDRPEMETGVYAELIPNYEENKEAELKKRSAVYWADEFPKDVPILLLHGNADWRVKSSRSLSLALEFEKYRIPYRLHIYEGGDHGLNEFKTEVNNEVLNWFEKYLKQGVEIPNMEYHGR